MTHFRTRTVSRLSTLLASAVLVAGFLLATVASAQAGKGLVLTERRQSSELVKFWIWPDGGELRVVGNMLPIIEQERTTLNITPSKVDGNRDKGSWGGTIGEPVAISESLGGGLPAVIRVNYRKVDRIQTERPFARITLEELPDEAEAILVICHLGGDEEVRCDSEPSPTKPDHLTEGS
jgi:hypothetical protein